MTERWELTDHVCRRCLARVVYARGVYRCTGCGDQGAHWTAICGCGLTVAGMRDSQRAARQGGKQGKIVSVAVRPDRPAGFRCGRNPHRTASNPAEIVLLLDGEVYEGGEPCP